MPQNETPITLVGNLTDDPELRFTPAGAAVTNFRMASTPRTFNKNTNEWDDGEPLYLTCNAWRRLAENAAETLTRGMRVIVQGRLRARSYTTKEGDKRTVMEVEVDELGPALSFATAKVDRQGGQGQSRTQGGGQRQQPRQQEDPWAVPASTQQGNSDPWGGQ